MGCARQASMPAASSVAATKPMPRASRRRPASSSPARPGPAPTRRVGNHKKRRLQGQEIQLYILPKSGYEFIKIILDRIISIVCSPLALRKEVRSTTVEDDSYATLSRSTQAQPHGSRWMSVSSGGGYVRDGHNSTSFPLHSSKTPFNCRTIDTYTVPVFSLGSAVAARLRLSFDRSHFSTPAPQHAPDEA